LVYPRLISAPYGLRLFQEAPAAFFGWGGGHVESEGRMRVVGSVRIAGPRSYDSLAIGARPRLAVADDHHPWILDRASAAQGYGGDDWLRLGIDRHV
jgi:hypothetical protein